LSLCIGAPATQTMAHSSRISSSATGLPIPSLTHGEMAIIAPYQRQIINLALSAYDTHEPFRRVLNFAEIQYTACLWGMMPSGVTDEASPFNECSHAYLAAAKAVLLAMRDMPQEKIRASAIVSRIDSDMALSGLSLITCQFSGEMFNTAEVISPEWTAVPAHAPSAVAFALLLVGSCGLGWGGLRWLNNQAAGTEPKVSH
jgi:hypothetical protein